LEVKIVLSEALNCVRGAGSIKPTSEIEYSALRWEVYAALQNTLDAMALIVADLGLKKPSAYSDLGRTLFEGGFLSKGEAEAAERIAPSGTCWPMHIAGFRLKTFRASLGCFFQKPTNS